MPPEITDVQVEELWDVIVRNPVIPKEYKDMIQLVLDKMDREEKRHVEKFTYLVNSLYKIVNDK